MDLLLTSDIEYHELSGTLEKEGQMVRVCLMKDAREIIDEDPVDVVLLDWGHNTADGLRTLRELKVAYPGIPVIVITDQDSEETAITAFRMGAKDYFKKPVNVFELREVLNNLMRFKSVSMEKRFPHMTREGAVSSLMVTATTTMSPKFLRVISYMADNLSKDISLQDLSKEAGMSKFPLCRGFKKEVGMTPMQFLARMRIERAKKLLSESALSVSMVALEVGFNDLSNFIKHFKRLTGDTPTAFKKSLKKQSLPHPLRQ